MSDPAFTDRTFAGFVINELRDMLSDLEAGLVPVNIVLYERIEDELRYQYDNIKALSTPRAEAPEF